MIEPLDDVRAVLRRARQHDEAWRGLADDWLDDNPYTVAGKLDPVSGWFVVYFVERVPPPIDLAVIFADLVHNLRSTLDHAVCHLTGNFTNTNIGFPVVRYERDWGSALGSKLKGFPVKWLDVVKEAQPFQYGVRAEQHPLWLIHHLDIEMKHRLLLDLAVTYFEWEPTFTFNRPKLRNEPIIQQPVPPGGGLRHGQEIIRLRPVSENDDLRIVDIERVDNASIGIGPASDITRSGGDTRLPNMILFVASVIAGLAPAFA